MADVNLTLKANNSDYVNKMLQSQHAAQKVYDTTERGTKREKGLIQDIEDELSKLEKARKKAYSIQDIEKYNKKIGEAKQHLQEYEKAGVGATKQTESLTSSIGKWALSLGGAVAILRLLKNAVLTTTAGINAFNIAGEIGKQVMYNLVTGATSLYNGLNQVIAAQEKLNALRFEEKIATYDAKIEYVQYRKAAMEAHIQTNTAAERIEKYNKAIEHLNKGTDIEIAYTKKRIAALKDLSEGRQGDEKVLLEYADLQIKLVDLQYNKYSKLNEMTSMLTGLEKKQLADREKLWEDYFDWIDREEKRKDKEAKARAKANYEFWKDWYDGLRKLAEDALKAKEKEDLDYWKFNVRIGELLFDKNKELAKEQYEELAKAMGFDPNTGEPLPGKDISIWSVLGLDEEKDSGKIEAMKEVAATIKDILRDIFDEQVELRERERELLDQRISETQQALETEVELYKAGYASNVTLKKQELEELKKQRDKALREEEAALKKQRTYETISQSINLASSVANILKEFTKLGPLGLVLSSVAIATMFGIFKSAKAKASEMSGYAKGGWTGDKHGGFRDETGEEVAGTVHKEEYVVRHGPARKFQEVLDAINKDDKELVLNRFNQLAPELVGGTSVNNISVENSGPNNRLDKINTQLHYLNKKLEPKKQVREQITDNGNELVYQRGNTIRTVRK